MRSIWRMFFVVAFVAGALPQSSFAGTDPTPGEIFKNHAAAVGYSAFDGTAKPFIVTMNVTTVDWTRQTHHALVVRHQAGPYYREDDTSLGATIARGFTDGGFWYATANNNVSTDVGLNRELDVTRAVIASEAFDSTVNPEFRSVKGADDVVRIHPDSGMIADVYFNRDTWLIDRVFIDPDNLAYQIDLSDYKRQGPVMVAMTRRYGSSDERVADFDTYHVTDFQWDASFDANVFAVPVSKQYMVYPKGGSATIPFDFHDGIVVEASLNGATGRLLIDPDQPGMFITSLLADKAGLIPDKTDVAWLGLTYDNPVLKSLSFGGAELRDIRVGVLDGNYLGHYDGIVGYDVLAQAIVDIDFPKRRITFADPATYKVSANRHGLPLVSIDGISHVIAKANGAPLLLEFYPQPEGQIAIWDAVASSRTVADEFGISNGYVNELDLGSNVLKRVRIDPVPTSFVEKWVSFNGSVGALEGGLLQQYDVTFDYPQSLVYIDPDVQP